MIQCKELGKSFHNKNELFEYLKENKDKLISTKKSSLFFSNQKGNTVFTDQKRIIKTLKTSKDFNFDDSYYYFVVNTSNILDSHHDVHIEGNWEDSVKENQGNVYLVFDHTLKRSEIIAMKQDIEMFTSVIPFSLVSNKYKGDTYALIYKVRKDKIINKEASEWLNSGYSFEASVRMYYTDVFLALNSDKPEDSKEKSNFDKYFPVIANKDDFDNLYYFWGIIKANNVMESSLVMFGSNPVTGLVNEENKKEAAESTSNILNFYNNIKF